jgi:transcription elongation GreA/GreB family factor
MNKKEILALVVKEISKLLAQAQLAAENAHKAAIDDQSVAETQYDTLAIEAAYLAEGQSRRIDELKIQHDQLTSFEVTNNEQVSVGALVELAYDDGQQKQILILPCGAGIQIHYQQRDILVMSPQAPLAKAIMNKKVDDDFELNIANKTNYGYVSEIY